MANSKPVTLVPVTTPPCMVCKRTSELEVDSISYDEWKNGALMQNAFAGEPEDVREMLMTGTHPDCWDNLFGE